MSSGYIRQRWEKKTNRETIIGLLFQKAYRYNALFEASGFGSKATLNDHLKKLQAEGIAEKAIENNETVYRLTLNPIMLLPEIKSAFFDLVVDTLDKQFPGLAVLINGFLLGMWEIVLAQRVKRIAGKPEYTPLELTIIAPEIIKKSIEELDTDNQIDDSSLALIVRLLSDAFRTHKSKEDSS